MKAAAITTINRLEVIDYEHVLMDGNSRTCAAGQARVRILASGICGAQLKELAGERGNEQFMPHLCGHEAAAIVEEVGQGVSVQLVGKKVVCHWRKGNGAEAFLPARYEVAGGKTIGGGHVTTLCQSAVVSANRITPVPDDVPDELCALLGCGLSTALGTIEQEAKLRFGESILIVGAGGVGLNLIQAARLACAYPIVAMDVVDSKQDVACKLGASVYLNARHTNPREAMNMFGLKGFDVIVDTSGSLEALEGTIPLLADGGRYVCLGQAKPGEDMKITSALNMFHGEQGRKVMWTQGGGFRPSVDIPRYISLWRSGRLDLDSIVSHRFPLADVNRGVELVRAGQAGRVMISMP